MEINKFLMRVGRSSPLRFQIFQLRDSLTKRLDDSFRSDPDLSAHCCFALANPPMPLDKSRVFWQVATADASLKWETLIRLARVRH